MTPDRAYRLVRTALKNGDLVRPEICSRCGAKPPRASDGRRIIHAHHVDYSKPLDVEWVCAKCHREETPLPAVMGAPTPGENNGASKLTVDAVRLIRESKESGAALGRLLGVHRSTVNKVRSGVYWKLAAAPTEEWKP